MFEDSKYRSKTPRCTIILSIKYRQYETITGILYAFIVCAQHKSSEPTLGRVKL